MITLQQRVHGTPPPANWKLDKLHQVLRVRKGYKNDGMQEENLLSLSYGNIVRKDLNTTDGLLPESFETYQIVEAGNIVMRLTDLQNDKRSLRQGLVRERGIITSAYDALEVAPDNDPRFWAYALLALDLAKYYYSLGGGVRQSIKFSDFPNDWVQRPDRETQRAIADFLDRETARIDQLVEKKQALVAALKQKTTDIADLLVTGAEDPTRQRTRVDSPWLSEIPTEWQLIRAKFLFEEMKRPVEEDDEVITAFRDGQVCLRSRRRTEGYTFAELEVGYQHICKGDLVIHTMDAFAGAIGVSEDDGKSTGEYAVCRPQSEDVIPEYYAYALRCMARRNYIFVLCPSVRERAPRFRFVRFAPVFLPVPPRDEQLAIVSRIENETAQLRVVQDKTIESIDRLREYRAALITAAVTGQLDISEQARKGDTDRRLDAIEAEMRP